MKNLMKVLATLVVLAMSAVVFTACSNDDDPADNDFFAGTYKGKVSYNTGTATGNISSDDGSVFVTKIASGTKYNFAFSNGIPDLVGVEFEKKGDNTLVSVGATEAEFIRIDNKNLNMVYRKDGKTWTATTTRN